MTTAVIRKLWSGGAVVELPKVQPHWFEDWRSAVVEVQARRLEFVLLEPVLFAAPVAVLASAFPE